MYAVTSIWLVSRTRQTLRRAEFGFLGVVVYTRVQTPRRCGAATFFLRPLPDFKPGVASFFLGALRPLRTSWEVVGIRRGMVAAAQPRERGDRGRAAPGRTSTPAGWGGGSNTPSTSGGCISRRSPHVRGA